MSRHSLPCSQQIGLEKMIRFQFCNWAIAPAKLNKNCQQSWQMRFFQIRMASLVNIARCFDLGNENCTGNFRLEDIDKSVFP